MAWKNGLACNQQKGSSEYNKKEEEWKQQQKLYAQEMSFYLLESHEIAKVNMMVSSKYCTCTPSQGNELLQRRQETK